MMLKNPKLNFVCLLTVCGHRCQHPIQAENVGSASQQAVAMAMGHWATPGKGECSLSVFQVDDGFEDLHDNVSLEILEKNGIKRFYNGPADNEACSVNKNTLVVMGEHSSYINLSALRKEKKKLCTAQ